MEGEVTIGSDSSKRRIGLADVTNMRRSEPGMSSEQMTISAKEAFARLAKENAARVEEKNKVIKTKDTELQKLKDMVQKMNQQNWQLARGRSQMLAEINSEKEKSKALEHKLRCTLAVLKVKTSELEEAKKMKSRQGRPPRDKIAHEANKIAQEANTKSSTVTKPTDVAEDAPLPADSKKPCNTNRKRTLRSRSLGPSAVSHQETAEEKEEVQRSRRRKSSNLKSETSEDLFEIKDVKLPIRSHASPLPVTDSVKEQSPQGQGPRRTSYGRPVRRAAEKVSSYKEVSVKIKMRRSE